MRPGGSCPRPRPSPGSIRHSSRSSRRSPQSIPLGQLRSLQCSKLDTRDVTAGRCIASVVIAWL